MKARKELKEQILMHEVVQQTSRRFAPSVADIKKVGCSSWMSVTILTRVSSRKAVDSLIDREYIRRKDAEVDVLEYLA